MILRAKHAVGRGPERLEERCLLAVDTPLIVEAVDLAGSGPTTLVGEITSPDEIDYYRFDIGQFGWLSVGGQAVGNSPFDGQIRLFEFSDANGNDSVEEDELDDAFLLETSFVGRPGTTYLLNPGTFVISVSADLDENDQGEVGGYTLSLTQSLAINLDNIETDSAVAYRATSAMGTSVGVGLNFVLSGISNSPSGSLRSESLSNFLSRDLILFVSSSGDLLIVNDAQPDTSASAGSGVTPNLLPISISATASNRIDTAQLPATVRPATLANRQATPVLSRSEPAGRSATRSIDIFRRGHSSQVGMIELALDEMLEATDDVLSLAADGLLKPLKETLGRPLEEIVPKNINIIELSQPSWPLGRWLWQMVVGPDEDGASQDAVDSEQDNRSPVVPKPEKDDSESDVSEEPVQANRVSPSAASGFASALIGALYWGNTSKASGTRSGQRSSRDDRYRRPLAGMIRRQLAR